MNFRRNFSKKIGLLIATSLLILQGCERELSSDATLATFPAIGDVYLDDPVNLTDEFFISFDPASGANPDGFDIDNSVAYAGSASIKIGVPSPTDPNGGYIGGIFKDRGAGRDLSGFDALTFWVKATTTATASFGFGTNFEGDEFPVNVADIEMATYWKQVVIPIPDPSKLKQEKGVFTFAAGTQSTNGAGFTFWMDEIRFLKTGTVAQPRPSIFGGQDLNQDTFNGSIINLTDLAQTWNLASGEDITVSPSPNYFEFTSSNSSVASVDAAGRVTVLSAGTATITAKLNGIDAAGSLTVNSKGPFVSAPTPTQAAANVISIFSDAYTNAPVEYYNGYWAPWQTTLGQNDITINGDNIINYTNLNFVGIQFSQPTINASSMTHFHVDVQVQEPLDPGDYLIVRLVDIGGDNAFNGGDDSSGEVRITASQLSQGNWASFDIALSTLGTLTSKANMAQIVMVSDATITDILVDNIYFYEVPTEPSTAAPTPTDPAADVISIFSDAYTNVAGTDFNPNWGQATQVSQVSIAGNNTLKYSGLNYQGTQFGANQDVSGMNYFHLDYYSATSTALNVYLISPGPVETRKALSVPTTAGWNSVDIPLSDFSPVDMTNVFQLKFDGNGDIFLDNIYFKK